MHFIKNRSKIIVVMVVVLFILWGLNKPQKAYAQALPKCISTSYYSQYGTYGPQEYLVIEVKVSNLFYTDAQINIPGNLVIYNQENLFAPNNPKPAIIPVSTTANSVKESANVLQGTGDPNLDGKKTRIIQSAAINLLNQADRTYLYRYTLPIADLLKVDAANNKLLTKVQFNQFTAADNQTLRNGINCVATNIVLDPNAKAPTPTPNGANKCDSTYAYIDVDRTCPATVDVYKLWRAEYNGNQPTKRTDLNGDGKVTGLDFAIWLKDYLKTLK